jgi:hypothetical protein
MAITRIGPNQSINLASNITGTLPTGNGGTGATSFAPGKVLQTVTALDGTNRATTSETFGLNSSTLTLNITPSATSSKILITCSAMLYISAQAARLTIFRDSTNLASATAPEDSFITTDGDGKYFSVSGMHFLDSPSSTSAVNYQIRFRNNQGSTTTTMPFRSALGVLTAYEIGA